MKKKNIFTIIVMMMFYIFSLLGCNKLLRNIEGSNSHSDKKPISNKQLSEIVPDRLEDSDNGLIDSPISKKDIEKMFIKPSRYGVYGHGGHKNPSMDELITLAFYNIRQGGNLTAEEIKFIKSLNPNFINVQYINNSVPMDVHGQTAGYIEKTDSSCIAMSNSGMLSSSIGSDDTSFKINKTWHQFVPSTLGEGIYYNADENDQNMNSIVNFVTWIKVDNEVMKVVDWDNKNKIITVVRGIWNTVKTIHPANSNVYSPMYFNEAYPNSNHDKKYLIYAFDGGAFNPDNPGLAVNWFVEDIPFIQNNLSVAIAAGSDGIWMDVCEPGRWNSTSVDGTGTGSRMWNFANNEQYTNETYTVAQNRRFKAIQDAWYNKTGTWPYLIGNSINKKWYWSGKGNQKTYLMSTDEKSRPLDGMCNENFVGSIRDAVVTYHDLEFWRDNVMMFMDAAQSGLAISPMIVNAGTKGRTVSDMNDEDRNKLELYGFASYLLGWEPSNPKTNIGVVLTYKNQQGNMIGINPIFKLDIGDPLFTYEPSNIDNYKVPEHSTYMRLYGEGIVLVNPYPEEDRDVPLNAIYKDPFTGIEYTTVSMSPNTGRILIK